MNTIIAFAGDELRRLASIRGFGALLVALVCALVARWIFDAADAQVEEMVGSRIEDLSSEDTRALLDVIPDWVPYARRITDQTLSLRAALFAYIISWGLPYLSLLVAFPSISADLEGSTARYFFLRAKRRDYVVGRYAGCVLTGWSFLVVGAAVAMWPFARLAGANVFGFTVGAFAAAAAWTAFAMLFSAFAAKPTRALLAGYAAMTVLPGVLWVVDARFGTELSALWLSRLSTDALVGQAWAVSVLLVYAVGLCALTTAWLKRRPI